MTSTAGVSLVVCSALAGSVAIYGIIWYYNSKPQEDTDKPTAAYQCASSKHQSSIGLAHPVMSLPQYSGCIYLDYNATTPIFPEVTAAMEPYTSSCFGNPSSPHIFSHPCREAIKTARNHVARLINAEPESICFTSCGTESDNMAIQLALAHYRKNNAVSPIPHIITSAIEHPAVLVYLQQLELSGTIDLTILQVTAEGFVLPGLIESALRPTTALVSIMHSNNEIGTIQPVREYSKVLHRWNEVHKAHVVLHADAAQSIGKVSLDVEAMGIDLLTIVGHKYGAPKGIAALYIRKGVDGEGGLVGGGQESGRRAGTENVLLIVALGEASRLARLEANEMLLHLLSLKKRMIAALLKGMGGEELIFNGPRRSVKPAEIDSDIGMLRIIFAQAGLDDKQNSQSDAIRNSTSLLLEQLPNTVSVSFQNVKASKMIPLLGSTVACSAGSACHSDTEHISPVLQAISADPTYALGTLRLSFGRHTTGKEIDTAVEKVLKAVKEAQGSRGR